MHQRLGLGQGSDALLVLQGRGETRRENGSEIAVRLVIERCCMRFCCQKCQRWTAQAIMTGLRTVLSHLNQVGCFRLANQQLASGSVVQVAVSGS
jgi:hypothetical protein